MATDDRLPTPTLHQTHHLSRFISKPIFGTQRGRFPHHTTPRMNGDPITIATLNTRSLGHGFTGRRKRKEIKSLFRQTTPTTDILLLQETKIPETVCLKQAQIIEFKGGSSLWTESSFSARTCKFKGGTWIVLASSMSSIVTHHGILYPGRAQFVVLNISPRLQLGIINVYGFSHTGARAMMW